MTRLAVSIKLKRVYDPPDASDGRRILVERLWPRGLTKQKAALDLWLKEVAPSSELRKWYNHQPERWEPFQEKYREELRGKPEHLDELLRLCREGPVTLVYAARDQQHNSALLLKDFLEGMLQRSL